MSSPTIFKDIGKAVSDLLNKEFPSVKGDKWNALEVSTKTKCADGTTVETKVQRDSAGAVTAELKPKWSFSEQGVEASFCLHAPSKKLCVEASSSKLLDGLKLTLKANAAAADRLVSDVAKTHVCLDAEYRHERVTANACVDMANAKGAAELTVAGVTQLRGFELGAKVVQALGAAPQMNELSLVAAHKCPSGEQVHLFRRQQPGKSLVYGAGYLVPVSPLVQLGTMAQLDTAAENATPCVCVAAQFKCNNGGSFKAKFGTSGRWGLAYTSFLHANVKATVGVDVAAADTSDHKVALAFKFE